MSAATSRSLTNTVLELTRSSSKRTIRSSSINKKTELNESIINPSNKMHSQHQQSNRKNATISSVGRVEIHHYSHDLYTSSLEGTLSRVRSMQQLGKGSNFLCQYSKKTIY